MKLVLILCAVLIFMNCNQQSRFYQKSGYYTIIYQDSTFLNDSILLKGRVLSNLDCEPIPYCSVGIFNTSRGIISDSSGCFSLKIPAGNHQIYAQSVGYSFLKTKRIECFPNKVLTIHLHLGYSIIE
jgi:hypothetical protein